MKKINIAIIVVCLLQLATNANAQKGSWYVGGQVGVNSKTEKTTGEVDTKTTSWNVAPEVGTFLNNNLQLGFAVNLSGSTEEQSPDKTTTTKFAPVVYLRHFYKIGDRFSTFAGIVGTVTTGSTTVNGTKYDLSGGGINVSLGAAYALSKTFTAVGQYGLFGYTSETTESDSYKNTVDNLGFNVNSLGPVFNVGIYWTFTQ